MQINEFLELVTKRRSIRRFKTDPIPDEYIEKMIEAARWAMSGGNAQPWEFIAIKDKETKKKIDDLNIEQRRQIWSIERTRIKELQHPSHAPGPPQGPTGFKDAPVYIVVCADPRANQASVLGAHFLHQEGGVGAHLYKDMANATQNICLAATALGLGTEWVSICSIIESPLKALLDVPEELSIHTLVAVGYPAYEPQPQYRRELSEILHYEKYDKSKYRSSDDIFQWLFKLRQYAQNFVEQRTDLKNQS
ncbi:nitroreductase family protein [Chloroflexota bacterium]